MITLPPRIGAVLHTTTSAATRSAAPACSRARPPTLIGVLDKTSTRQSLRSGQIPALADKTARQLSRANAAVYEKTSKVVSNLNASAILIGSLSSMLKEMESARDPPLR